MRITLVPFEEKHLEQAGELLARRHQANRDAEQALPFQFTDPPIARAAVETTWRTPRAEGLVALEQGRMIGYLIGVPKIDSVWGRSAWFPLAGHALDRNTDAEIYRDLYAALSPNFVNAGCFAHFILVPSSDQPALDAWFALSFGKEQAYAIRETTPPPVPTTLHDSSIEIVRATPADLKDILAMADIIGLHQARSPVYGIFLPEGPDEWPEDYSELLADPSTPIWLARRNGRLVGTQLYMPAELSSANLLVPDRCVQLTVASTREEERGRGINQALTAHGLAWAYSAGYTCCETDWRVTNLLSSRFWPRQGFRPTAYRLSRRIDDRIAWAHGKRTL